MTGIKLQVTGVITKLGKQWDEFWFQSHGGIQMRTFRFAVGCILFYFFLSRTFDLTLFYSDSGILRVHAIDEVTSFPYRYSLLSYFTSKSALWFFHITFLCSLITMAFGIFPRASALIAAVLHISFLHRDMAVAFGVDTIATYYLIYLCFADYSDPVQVDADQSSKTSRAKNQTVQSIVGSMVFRFSQIQICIVYGYSGLEKIRGTKWWQGEAIWDVLANHQLARWDFTWVSAFPLIVVFSTYLTVLWEVYFPVLVWIKPCRRITLFFGVLLHLGIALAMNIPTFAAIMVATYILFLNTEELEKVHLFFRKIFHYKQKLVLTESR